MTTNDFNPEIINSNLNSVQYYVDNDGSLKFTAPVLSSSNFDGMIPAVETSIAASDIKAGMLLEISENIYFPVISLSYDDPILDEAPSNIITVGYIDDKNELNTIDYNLTDSVNVRYEDWTNKTLGNQGWAITSGGNAIFTNIAARGRIEAEEGYISGALTIGSGGSTTINDLATTADLNGYIPDGAAAADIISNSTTITGGNIFTGTIQSQFYGYTSGFYSNNGMQIGLDGNGYIRSPNFYLDPSGNAYFRGQINALSGFFGNESINWSIGTESVAGYPSAFMKSGTLKLYTTTTGTPAVQHGIITLDNGSGLSAGSLSNALSVPLNKNINGLGNGLHLGTGTDYFFVPGTGNSAKPRIRSNGFDFFNSSDNISIRVGNSELSIPSTSTINFWDDSQNPAAFLDYGPGNNQLIIGVGAGPGGSTFNGIVNFRASDVRLNGTSIVSGGGGGGGVTSFKFGDTGPTETGAVSITGTELINAINDFTIPNSKLENRSITIGSVNPVSRNLGGTFGTGTIDGSVLSADSVEVSAIKNDVNLFTLGSTGVKRGNTVVDLPGISSMAVNAGGLNYVFNLGFTPINLNRTTGNAFLSGVVASANNLTALTGLSSLYTNNAILYNSAGLLGSLPTGTSGQFLRSGGTSAAPAWETVNVMTNPMTGFGDLIYGSTFTNPSTPGRIAPGTQGSILKMITSFGITLPAWLAPGANGSILRVSSGDTSWLAPGTDGHVLTLSGGNPTWMAAPGGGGGSGTVTSVGLSAPTSVFTVSNSPVTTTGTLNLSLTTSGGGDRNVLRSISSGAVGMGKISGGHMNYTGPNTTYNPFMRMNSSTGDINLTNLNNSASSIRYKKIINEPINLDSSWLDQINLIKFKYNLDIQSMGEEKAPVIIGLLAEELSENEVLNQLVSYDTENLPAAVDYEKISLLLIPIIKELRDKVAGLEARLDAAGL